MFKEEELSAKGIRISIFEDKKEIGHARIYFLENDLHKKPFCFLEDVFIEEEYRGKGHGKKLIKKAVQIAKKNGAYKLLGTSRYSREKVHKFYQDLGFSDYGKELRITLDTNQ